MCNLNPLLRLLIIVNLNIGFSALGKVVINLLFGAILSLFLLLSFVVNVLNRFLSMAANTPLFDCWPVGRKDFRVDLLQLELVI